MQIYYSRHSTQTKLLINPLKPNDTYRVLYLTANL
jgi:hypothetical protein